MAEVDGIVLKRPTGVIGAVVGYADLTGATSTIGQATHQFSNRILAAHINVSGTNTMTYTISTTTITVTGTNNDRVWFTIWGE